MTTQTAIAHNVNYSIAGAIAQSLTLSLDPGESAWASRGAILAIDAHLGWRLKVPGGAGAAMGRMMAGEGLSLTFISARKQRGDVVLGAPAPGKIIPWSLVEQGPIVATRGAFLCALGDCDIAPTTAKRVGALLFGGSGMILQKISGQGTAFIHGSGDFVVKKLDAGQRLEVSTGNLAAFSASVDYGIKSVAGCRNKFFGGEGLFMAELTGPGTVLLQTLKRVPVRTR